VLACCGGTDARGWSCVRDTALDFSLKKHSHTNTFFMSPPPSTFRTDKMKI
jgi:hypothetical protein